MADMYGPSPKAAGLAAALQQLTGAIPLYHKLRGDEEDRQFRLQEQQLRQQEIARRNQALDLAEQREGRMTESALLRDALTIGQVLPKGTTFPAGGQLDSLLSRAGLAQDQKVPMPFVGSPMSPMPPSPEGPEFATGQRTNIVPRDPIKERQVLVAQVKAQNNIERENIRRQLQQLRLEHQKAMQDASLKARWREVQASLGARANELAQRWAALDAQERYWEATDASRLYLGELNNQRGYDLFKETPDFNFFGGDLLGMGGGAEAAPSIAPPATAPAQGGGRQPSKKIERPQGFKAGEGEDPLGIRKK